MDPFVRRLVERLFDPGKPLSRNKHFHVFDNPEGRKALRVSARLETLQHDVRRCLAAHGPKGVRVHRTADGFELELDLRHLGGRRVAKLDEAELEILRGFEGLHEALTPD